MRVLGIIAECNPLHKGHIDLISRARKTTGADFCIVLLSGDYVQRGAPACIDKYTRSRALLENGADIVIELPLYTALSSADGFARGAVAMADRLGVVTDLCFGSECGDIEVLERSASALYGSGPDLQEFIRERVAEGSSYPEAFTYAAGRMGIRMPDTPNDILGLQYLIALKERGSGITAHALPRTAAPSASELRSYYMDSDRLLHEDPPDAAMALDFRTIYAGLPALSEEDFSDLLLYKLREELFRKTDLTRYYDVSRELCDRLWKALPSFTSFGEMAGMIKCRNYTYTRISRVLMHIILGMTEEEAAAHKASGYASYIHLLGMRSSAGPALSMISSTSGLTVITGSKRSYALLDPLQQAVMDREEAAGDLYEAILWKKTYTHRNDMSRMQQQRTRRFLMINDEV